MPKVKCDNKECSNFGVVEHFAKVRYVWNEKTERLEADETNCPVCGKFRDTVKEYEGFTNAWHKAEGDRNYDNRKIKKYDYDHAHDGDKVFKLNKKSK